MTLRIYIVAGEPSGDALGARLLRALREGGTVEAAGIGGELMASEGVASLFPQTETAVMGVFEVLPRARKLLQHMEETVADILRFEPDAVITIDSGGFNKGLARRLIAAHCRAARIHYVAPMVWVWAPGRARGMARLFDHLMTLWSFEPPLFERQGLASTFVGHSLVEAAPGDGAAFRARHGVAPESMLLAVLPGSRVGEVRRLLPVFRETLEHLSRGTPGLHLAVPTVGTVADRVREAVADWPWPTIVTLGEAEKQDAFAASRAALGASGTVALELALAGVPQVTAYRLNPATALIGQIMIRKRRFCPVNILLDRPVVPELIQGACRPGLLVRALEPLLCDGKAREAQLAAFRELANKLGGGSMRPSLRAADTVRRIIRETNLSSKLG
ncbi:MAG: lipid-A-disaccharide synthase [Alphaproteobacteria bacterium]|nr:lipid-A-disaccharide synthase [Alphaproteobacteria bacterium]